MKEKIKAVVFDMDGVIFDSERVLMEEWIEIAREYHLDNIEEVYVSVCGTTMQATEKTMKETYGEDFPFEELENKAYAMRDAKYQGKLPLKPGIRELLSYLKDQSVKIALATSTVGNLAKEELQQAHLLDYFDVLITGDMVTKSKPDPEIFCMAMEQLGIRPENAAIIEDSFNGVRAGQASGAHVFMVPDLRKPDDEITALCDQIFPTLLEVREYLTDF